MIIILIFYNSNRNDNTRSGNVPHPTRKSDPEHSGQAGSWRVPLLDIDKEIRKQQCCDLLEIPSEFFKCSF